MTFSILWYTFEHFSTPNFRGTPGFLYPEWFQNKNHPYENMDLWAVGIMLVEFILHKGNILEDADSGEWEGLVEHIAQAQSDSLAIAMQSIKASENARARRMSLLNFFSEKL